MVFKIDWKMSAFYSLVWMIHMTVKIVRVISLKMDLLAFALKKANARLAMTTTLETLSHLRTKIASINVPAIQDATSTPTMIQAMNKFMTNVFCCQLAVQKLLVDLDATLETSIATSPFQHPQHQRQ